MEQDHLITCEKSLVQISNPLILPINIYNATRLKVHLQVHLCIVARATKVLPLDRKEGVHSTKRLLAPSHLHCDLDVLVLLIHNDQSGGSTLNNDLGLDHKSRQQHKRLSV